MADGRPLRELAAVVGGEVVGDEDTGIRSVASIETADTGDITFVASPKYRRLVSTTKASAIIVAKDTEPLDGVNLLCVENPYLAFAKLLEIFRPAVACYEGVHPKAEIHSNAVIGAGASIYPYVVVDDGVKIGKGVVVYPGVYLGYGVEVGDYSVIHSNVSIMERCTIGKRVTIHSNTVIGSDGFGYVKSGEKNYKIPQIGAVVIEDEVEIGAGVTIDRATLGTTAIGKGTKIDNLVQIGHNVEIGENSIIVAQVGIAGSVKIGKRVTIGGQVGVAGHIEIGDDTMVGARSGVAASLPAGGIFTGVPAKKHTTWLRIQGATSKLPEMARRLRQLEEKVEDLARSGKGSDRGDSADSSSQQEDI